MVRRELKFEVTYRSRITSARMNGWHLTSIEGSMPRLTLQAKIISVHILLQIHQHSHCMLHLNVNFDGRAFVTSFYRLNNLSSASLSQPLPTTLSSTLRLQLNALSHSLLHTVFGLQLLTVTSFILTYCILNTYAYSDGGKETTAIESRKNFTTCICT